MLGRLKRSKVMILNDSTQHLRKITTTIDEEELEDIILDHIAKKAGLLREDPSFCGRAFHSTSSTGLGIKHEMRVEIVIDINKLPGGSNEY
jgi:hypothetical protein